jgi:hypothetical protein
MKAGRLIAVVTGLNAAAVVWLFVASSRPAGAAGAPETIRARAIELVDQQGRVRAQLNVEPDGEAVLRLRDPRGEIRVKIGAGADGSGLVLLDGATEPAIHMLAKNTGPTITLSSKGARRVLTP